MLVQEPRHWDRDCSGLTVAIGTRAACTPDRLRLLLISVSLVLDSVALGGPSDSAGQRFLSPEVLQSDLTRKDDGWDTMVRLMHAAESRSNQAQLTAPWLRLDANRPMRGWKF